jgi:hypothetical protein
MRRPIVARAERWTLEAYSQGLSIASNDHQEGLAAFFDKRPPKFSGR